MDQKPSVYRYLVIGASLVVIVAGLRAAHTLVVPFLLAAFFTVILTPVLHWLQRKRVPTVISLLIILGAIAVLGGGVLILVGRSFNDFSDQLPTYQASLRERAEELTEKLREWGFEVPETEEPDAQTADLPNDQVPEESSYRFNIQWLLGISRSMLGGLGNLFSNAFVVFITAVFMLLEAWRMPAKIAAALDESTATMKHIDEIISNIRRYMQIKTATSALTGFLVTIFLTLVGVEYAILWGLLAFLFNYVPSIGSIIAAVPPVVMTLFQAGLPEAGVVAAGYAVVNCVISFGIEPRFMGEGLGLSTLIVFLSLVFWGWVLGPVGMLLSAPLTMIVKIVLHTSDDTRWISVLMGSRAPRGES